MNKEIEGKLQQLQAAQMALRLILVALIDRLTVGMADSERTESITRLFNIACDAIELAALADTASEWTLAIAKREVTEIASRLLLMGVEEE